MTGLVSTGYADVATLIRGCRDIREILRMLRMLWISHFTPRDIRADVAPYENFARCASAGMSQFTAGSR